MPALVGGFGKIINYIKNFHPNFFWEKVKSGVVHYSFNVINSERKKLIWNSITSDTCINEINRLRPYGPYLAGLIEGDGTFQIKDATPPNTKSNYNPQIIIVFKIADYPVAQHLSNLTNCGTIYKYKDRNYVLWRITTIKDVYIIVSVINGYIRTPKYETLIRYHTFFNEYFKDFIKKGSTIINIIGLDKSPITSNSWAAGFIDADGHFAISISKRSNGNASPRITLRFSIEQRITYHKYQDIFDKSSYSFIMHMLSDTFNGSVYSRTRTINNKTYTSFIIITFQNKINIEVISYLDKYPLWSSKYLDYVSWKKIVILEKSSTSKSDICKIAYFLRNDFNKTRTTFKWDHLNSR